ncbi:Thioredoxin-dependent peroxide reductase [Fasciolopsis buskii]|uniref:Thioredoxin peroxidase n=1 Tax=Fasciolopsis buskii TaxID=27845 RepID=A0A8E0RQ09_9TREM|nr:Thioredoxin-dependent peroxide reductase [Fasciolopsis buski]
MRDREKRSPSSRSQERHHRRSHSCSPPAHSCPFRGKVVLQPNAPAPKFTGQAVVGKEIKTISLSDYKDKWVVLAFYPLDFTFVCPTEIVAFSDSMEQFTRRNCEVIFCSTDSVYSHLQWTKMDRKSGGVGELKFPLLADKNMFISRAYGVLDEKEGNDYRGTFIIDPKGILRQVTVNDRQVGRSVEETLRLLDAFIFFEEHGEVCPANWKPNSKTIVPTPEGSKAYFSSAT